MYKKRYNDLEIIVLFTSDYHRKFYLREISRLSGLTLRTTQNTLSKLEKQKLIISELRGKNKYFSLNMGNIQTKNALLQAEIYKSSNFLEKYPQFKLFLKSIGNPSSLLVFGSFARMKTRKDSDVDILEVSSRKKPLPTHLLPNRIHHIHLTEKDYIKAYNNKEPLIKEIEESHIILNNHSYFVNIWWEWYSE